MNFAVSVTLGQLTCDKTYHFRARANNSIGDAAPGQILSFKTSACGGGGEPGTVQLVEDPSFEEGDGGWWVSDDDGDFYIDDRFNTPRSGDFYAYLTNFNGTAGDSLSGGFISPEITIPNSATDADLRFFYRIETQETTTSVRDKVEVYLVRNGDNLTKLTTISNLDATTSYTSRNVDLSSSFYGETVQIFFAGSTNGSLPTKFRVDDVSLEVDVPAGGPPDVTTEDADQVTSSSARLNMTVDPNGADTEIWFDLEPGDSTPSDDTEHINIGAGSGNRAASISVFGLECDTKYYFRAHAENSHDRANGSVEDFTTKACSGGPPNADTDPAKDITKTSATLTADVDPNGLPTQAWFAWGDDADLGLETQHVSVGSGTSNVDFLQTIIGLTCGTTYYFENHAQNSAGHDDGVTLEFTTDSCDEPSVSNDFLLFAGRQGCSGNSPAVALGWIMPAGASPIVVIERLDGAYAATVNTEIWGPQYVITSGLQAPNAYQFRARATVNNATVVSNTVTAYAYNAECGRPVGPADPPQRLVAWALPAFCEDGVAKVKIRWESVLGALTYRVERIGLYMPSATYTGITSTELADTTVTAGAGALYIVAAENAAGSTQDLGVGVYVPGTVCSSAGAPGSFAATVTREPYCNVDRGRFEYAWTQASGAGPGYRHLYFENRFLTGGDDFDDDFIGRVSPLPGKVGWVVSQAESATTPGVFRESNVLARLIPENICGTGTALPSASAHGQLYVDASSALLRGSVHPGGAPTTGRFEWGLDTSYGSVTPTRDFGRGFDSITLGEVVSGLTCNTTYHYRLVATNTTGTTVSPDAVFTTGSCDPTQCFVNVISPAGGETWVKNTPQTIRWTAGPGCVSFGFRLLRGGVHDGWVDTDTALTGTEYDWTPAAWLIPGSNLQIDLAGYDTAGHGSGAISNNFSLVNPEVLPSLIFEDTVETEMSNWNFDSWVITNSTAHSPTHSRADSPGFYENSANNSVYPPRIDITGRRSLLLTFWERHNLADFDSGNVWVSADGGPFVHVRKFTGTQLDWRPATIDLAQFIGRQTIRIAFQVYSDASLTADGWYIDDIKIYEPPPLDFYTVTPCRLVDTRQQTPLLPGNVPLRTFAVTGVCGIPPTARAVSLNVTAVSATGGGYIKLFAADQVPPTASTVNFAAGQTRANNALLGLSDDGRLGATFSGSGQVGMALDVNGYFAEAAHPMVGTWEGTIATYASILYIEQDEGEFTARVSMAGANQPIEDLTVSLTSETEFRAIRPLDNNAELRLSLVQSGPQKCLNGGYLELGTSRPISLCKTF